MHTLPATLLLKCSWRLLHCVQRAMAYSFVGKRVSEQVLMSRSINGCIGVRLHPEGLACLTDGLVADDGLVVALCIRDALLRVSLVAQRADQLLQHASLPVPPNESAVYYCGAYVLCCARCHVRVLSIAV